MMAYFQRILMTSLLLLVITEESKGNEDNMGGKRTITNGACCQTPGDQTDVKFKDKENIEIECRKKEQGGNISWYYYGSERYGLDIFTRSSGMKFTVPSNGGIFACATEESKATRTSAQLCNSHKTIIIPPADTQEYKHNAVTYVEGERVTLNCHVDLKVSYAFLWIAKYNGITKCLSSVEVIRDIQSMNFTNNTLCCPTEGIYQIYNRTQLLHYLDINNITTSQSGDYLCAVFSHNNGAYSWKIVNETSIKVTNKATNPTDAYENADNATTYEQDTHEKKDNAETFKKGYIIASATIGVLAAIGLILCLVIVCIKYKGKQRKVNHRHSNAPTTEYECTPYAVSLGQHNDLQTIYAKAQEPLSMNGAEYTEIELTRVPACNDVEYSDVVLGPPAKPIPEYSYIGTKPPAEPSSEYSEVGMEYSKID